MHDVGPVQQAVVRGTVYQPADPRRGARSNRDCDALGFQYSRTGVAEQAASRAERDDISSEGTHLVLTQLVQGRSDVMLFRGTIDADVGALTTRPSRPLRLVGSAAGVDGDVAPDVDTIACGRGAPLRGKQLREPCVPVDALPEGDAGGPLELGIEEQGGGGAVVHSADLVRSWREPSTERGGCVLVRGDDGDANIRGEDLEL